MAAVKTVVPSEVKVPGFVRRPHRSRGRSKAGLGARAGGSLSRNARRPLARQGCPLSIRAGLASFVAKLGRVEATGSAGARLPAG